MTALLKTLLGDEKSVLPVDGFPVMTFGAFVLDSVSHKDLMA
jgi:hypothetical protein